MTAALIDLTLKTAGHQDVNLILSYCKPPEPQQAIANFSNHHSGLVNQIKYSSPDTIFKTKLLQERTSAYNTSFTWE